jgi:hypothetical protein
VRRAHSVLVSVGVGSVLAAATVVACGSRTELDVPLVGLAARDGGVRMEGHDGQVVEDTGPREADDSGFDAPIDTGFDAAIDVGVDVFIPPDSGLRCDDGGIPTAYLLDDSSTLYTFDPSTLGVQALGSFACPDPLGSTPFTLSVSREGKAYVLYESWNIYEVDLATLQCVATPFQLGQLGLDAELAVAISRSTGAEKLLVSGVPDNATAPILAESDLTTFVLSKVGDIAPAPPSGTFPIDTQADLMGHLFGLSDDGLMLEMDVNTGAVLSTGMVNLPQGSSWAVMAYENQVYAFSNSTVFQYDPSTGTSVEVGDVGIEVIGASAVPCSGAD